MKTKREKCDVAKLLGHPVCKVGHFLNPRGWTHLLQHTHMPCVAYYRQWDCLCKGLGICSFDPFSTVWSGKGPKGTQRLLIGLDPWRKKNEPAGMTRGKDVIFGLRAVYFFDNENICFLMNHFLAG